MNFGKYLKQLVESTPSSVSKYFVHVPFTFRLGLCYSRMSWSVRKWYTIDKYSIEENFLNLRNLVAHSLQSIPFYQSYYANHGFTIDGLKSADDWNNIPIVSKIDMQNASLFNRSTNSKKGLKINTGGTSGQPLEFYLDRQAFAREWAHMHYIWKARGYKPNHLKLTLRGKHFERKQILRYNAVHNEYIVNASAPMSDVVKAVIELPRRDVIRWIHGYPSLVAEFAHECTRVDREKFSRFRSNLFGILLGSEYPVPVYRTVIEDVLSTNVVSWYGHSEMAILARETAKGIYESFPTYGFAEAVPDPKSGAYRLVCTSLHNRVHPFIRYDTGDLIEPISNVNGSLSFRILEGRVGDYIVDKNGMKHSLTAIIFGRHHDAFEFIKHIQVRQEFLGKISILVVPRSTGQDHEAIMSGLNLNDLDLDWSIKIISEPIRSASGKILLKVNC